MEEENYLEQQQYTFRKKKTSKNLDKTLPTTILLLLIYLYQYFWTMTLLHRLDEIYKYTLLMVSCGQDKSQVLCLQFAYLLHR